MALKTETTFRRQIRPLLYSLPNTTIFPIQQLAISGTPDFLLCINGIFVALECKANEKEKPTALQQYNLDKVDKSGGFSFVVFPENWQIIYTKLQHLSGGDNVQVKVFGYQK